MNYSLLSEWVKENSDFSGSVESCYLLPEIVIFTLKGGDKLCFVLSNRDSFIYFDNSRLDLSEAKSIWQNLKNSRIDNLRIAEQDRIIYFNLSHQDIYQQNHTYILVAELMMPQPNLIFCNSKMQIIDSIRKYTYADNPQRQILPGLPYQPPKTSFQISGRDSQAVQTDVSEINTMFKDRYNNFVKLTAKEDFLKIQINTLNKELKKLSKKLKHQEADLSQAEKADLWLAYAEGLKPNLPKIKTGQLHFTTVNYFDPDLQDICIPLLPEKSSLENMQIYMKKYHKAKKGLSVITENLKKTVGEIENTQQLIHRLQSGEIIDLNLGKQAEAKQIIQKASISDKLMNLKIGEDWQIVIGRKAKENDFITTELARPHDWWFHSRIYHGAHVLLRCFKKQEATPELIKHCCNLAAWYSQAKFSQNVPVDYTQIRFVRKPRKSPAGYVIYSNHHTFYATPMDIRALRELLGL